MSRILALSRLVSPQQTSISPGSYEPENDVREQHPGLTPFKFRKQKVNDNSIDSVKGHSAPFLRDHCHVA